MQKNEFATITRDPTLNKDNAEMAKAIALNELAISVAKLADAVEKHGASIREGLGSLADTVELGK